MTTEELKAHKARFDSGEMVGRKIIEELFEMVDLSASKRGTAFVAWTNTDLTEGRGWQIPLAVCQIEETARRMGVGQSVQGSDCDIREVEIFLHKGQWYGPVQIIQPTNQDSEIQSRVTAKRKALARAKELGMTEQEIKALNEQP